MTLYVTLALAFQGDDMLDQLKKIAKVIGPPSKTYVNEIDSEAKVICASFERHARMPCGASSVYHPAA